ncbi:uncharacterized protein FIBRA_06919 [Fibroporia radiculosa]|uniref:Uncharacterized protein n=1 Tax=Fibroporia radiculosa TaxID=599839 RepID=J4IBI7_9APHY|nr:uncharacterized protein FIBRA_06919 [Fibroporia radiculosa]CCM04731.1 predicted protein [Fibroporia radiculosa]
MYRYQIYLPPQGRYYYIRLAPGGGTALIRHVPAHLGARGLFRSFMLGHPPQTGTVYRHQAASRTHSFQSSVLRELLAARLGLNTTHIARANARNWTLTGPVTASYEPLGYLFDSATLNESLRSNKAVVCALSASYISTFAGYPLDSIKSRLQTIRTPITVTTLALQVYREEGIVGFYRGLWIPLMTISFVRAASFTIYTRTKEYFRDHHMLERNTGALSGSLISFGSAPFELVKVRRQLEYSIAASKGLRILKAPGTFEAVRDIFRTYGLGGLYLGFRLHFVRDTLGTGLYFFEYDGMRHLMGRLPSGEQGPTPSWMPLHPSMVPFMCGSLAGVTSWALIYPLDVVKTKVQQRALAGERSRTALETLHRLIRGPDPNAPKPILLGLARLYRGLGDASLRNSFYNFVLAVFMPLTTPHPPIMSNNEHRTPSSPGALTRSCNTLQPNIKDAITDARPFISESASAGGSDVQQPMLKHISQVPDGEGEGSDHLPKDGDVQNQELIQDEQEMHSPFDAVGLIDQISKIDPKFGKLIYRGLAIIEVRRTFVVIALTETVLTKIQFIQSVHDLKTFLFGLAVGMNLVAPAIPPIEMARESYRVHATFLKAVRALNVQREGADLPLYEEVSFLHTQDLQRIQQLFRESILSGQIGRQG